MIKYGKPLDPFVLKGNYKKALKQVEIVKAVPGEAVYRCPVCQGIDLKRGPSIYRFTYQQCQNCTHVFVTNYLKNKNFYQTNQSYQSTYTDKKKLSIRTEVMSSKAKWIVESFKSHFLRFPKSFIDLGAGSGHFIHCLRAAGYLANGIEVSSKGIQFAKEVFKINLYKKDINEFINQCPPSYEVVTMLGSLEHLENPAKVVYELRKSCKMIVLEVPNWESVSTTIQCITKQASRHAVPFEHVQMFTKRSLTTLLENSGFKPISWWFFGMDIYELACQIAYNSKLDPKKVYKGLEKFQKGIDEAQKSDFMMVCAV